jgi:hypothetical protein|nr:MAG TPA: Large Terminase [Caudoviricetes sp.]
MIKRAKKQVSGELLKRWDERVSLITRTTFDLGECEETKEERVRRAKEDYNYFVRTYFSHIAPCDSAKFHLDAAKYIAGHPRARALFEWARGHAKSTHMGCLIPLWILARGENLFRFIVLVSSSNDNAKGLLADLQAELANNEAYIQDFGIKADKGTEWTSGKFSLADGTTFVAIGRGQSPRGLKKNGQRPDYILIDDIDDDQLSNNESRVRKAYNWVMGPLYGTMAGGRGRLIMVGNRFAKNMILAHFANINNLYHTRVNIIDSKGNPSWGYYSREDIQAMRDEQGEISFAREYLNNPIEEGAVFKPEWMRYTKILPLKEYVKIIAYTDPSFKSTKANDFKATMLVGKTKEGYYHVLKAYAGQCSVAEMVAWHYDIEMWIERKKGRKPPRYYMEANFIQDLLLKEFKDEGVARGGRQIPITPDKRKKPDKYSRIETMQPLFERGFVLFNEEERESEGLKILIDQLLATEKGSRLHDDAPDALESAIWMLNKVGSDQRNYMTSKRPDRHY